MPYRWRSKKPAQRDANEAEIIRELQDRGATVVMLDYPVDLVVGFLGRWTFVEIKNGPNSPLKPGQKQFLADCANLGLPAVLVDHLDDVDVFWPVTGGSGPVRRPLTARKLDPMP